MSCTARLCAAARDWCCGLWQSADRWKSCCLCVGGDWCLLEAEVGGWEEGAGAERGRRSLPGPRLFSRRYRLRGCCRRAKGRGIKAQFSAASLALKVYQKQLEIAKLDAAEQQAKQQAQQQTAAAAALAVATAAAERARLEEQSLPLMLGARGSRSPGRCWPRRL